MKCEDIEEDNDKSEILHLSTALSTLDPSSLPTIKEEIKNEPECYATQFKLESTNETIIHSIIKPEKTSNAPSYVVCEDLGFKEELCVDGSTIYVNETNFTNEIYKNVEFQNKDDQIMKSTFLNKELNLYRKDGENSKCDNSIKSYTQKINIKAQLLTQNEHRPHICEACGKGFKQNTHLKTHLLSHGEHRPYKCDVCGKSFKHKGHLKTHLIKHGGHRPYECDICSKRFNEKGNLKTHLLVHVEQRPHKCGVCGKCFKLKCHLIGHLVTHGEQRPHKCSVCGNRFKLKGRLKTHIKIHSKHRPQKN